MMKVAEDAALLRRGIGQLRSSLGLHPADAAATADLYAAVSRLAAKAQGYEAAIRQRDESRGAMRLAASERDAAVADNEELVHVLAGVWRKVAAMHYEGLGLKEAIDAVHPGARACMGCYRALHTNSADEHCPYGKAANAPHPGAALLEVANLLRQHQSPDEADVLTTLKRILEERRR